MAPAPPLSGPPDPETPSTHPPSALVDGDVHPWRTLLAALSPLLWVLSLLLLVAALVAGALASLLGTEAGARWALAQVPGLEVRGWQGALLGDTALSANSPALSQLLKNGGGGGLHDVLSGFLEDDMHI